MNRIQILQFVNHGSLAWLIESLGYDGVEVGKILLISPSHDDYFPRSRILVNYVNNWDLNLAPPGSFPNVDLAISLSVMMYSSNPVLWISNILSISNPYILQDLKYRKRSSDPSGLGEDFDTIRYTCNFGAPATQPTFVLSSIGDQLEDYFEFPGVGTKFHDQNDRPVHICAAVRAKELRSTRITFANRIFFLGHNFFMAALRNLAHRAVLKLRNLVRLG